MKIVLCGSISFIEQMEEIAKRLTDFGHEVKYPMTTVAGNEDDELTAKEFARIKKKNSQDTQWVINQTGINIMTHFRKIDWGEAILVVNVSKNGVENYIGGNTLMEMGLAFWLEKKIYLLYPIPDMAYSSEIRGVKPIILNGSIEEIG